jgi:hypothetical protein
MALVPAALAAGFCSIRFFPTAQRARTDESKPRAAALKPVAAEALPPVAAPVEPEPPEAALSTPPEAPEKPASAHRRAQSPRQAAGMSAKPEPSYAIRVTGSEQPPAAAVPPPSPAARLAEAAGPAVPKVGCPLPPVAAQPAAPAAAPEPQPAPDAAAAEKPQSGGNSLSRALGKVNPFRRKAKYDTSEAAQAPLKKD